MPNHPPVSELRKQVNTGGAPKYHEANAARGKLFARDRIASLVDADTFVEDGQLANVMAGDLPSDGVVTGTAMISGRPVALMANDSTVKAGSWGARTVEKIIRIIERAYELSIPMVWLVDSAGARITDQVDRPCISAPIEWSRWSRVRRRLSKPWAARRSTQAKVVSDMCWSRPRKTPFFAA